MVKIKVVVKDKILEDNFFASYIKPVINATLKDFFNNASLKKKNNLFIHFYCTYDFNKNKIVNTVKNIKEQPEKIIDTTSEKIMVLDYGKRVKTRKYSSG